MKPEASLLYLQLPATCPLPVADHSGPHLSILSIQDTVYCCPVYRWVFQMVPSGLPVKMRHERGLSGKFPDILNISSTGHVAQV